MRFFVLILMISVFFSCSKKEEIMDDTIYYSGSVFIGDTVITEVGQAIVIEAGAEISFGPKGILVANGDLEARGTAGNTVKLIGSQEMVSHRIIRMGWDSKKFEMNYVEVTDGLIASLASQNHLNEVTFTNTKMLEWNDALARFWFTNLLIENCRTIGNNRGEGFLVHNIDEPIVRNCNFYKTPDAVEFIDCNDGEISGNIFRDMGDDGVDQNSCHNTLITNNEFYNVADRALELGSEGFGRSESLSVINNLFVNCKVAINLKESSNVLVENSTFYRNSVALDVDTPADSLVASHAVINASVFYESKDKDVKSNNGSITEITDCIGDNDLQHGSSNVVSAVEFVNPDNEDFTIMSGTFPSGFNAETIGYQKGGL